MELRPYQQEAVDAVYDHLRTKDNNPCIVLPTGTGKSVVIAKIVSDAIEMWKGRVLILAHVKELLEQNAAKIKAFLPNIPVGIYSAGLKSRDTEEPVIVAGIQSVHNKACDLGAFDLILVDEAHLIPTDGEGMYNRFLAEMKVINPKIRVVGLTATPFRLKGGLICKPENILNEVCYEAGLKEMIEQGYLSPIVARAGETEADFSKLHIQGGEFVAKEVEKVMNLPEITNAACKEIVELTQERKTVLIFCTSVDHSRHVAEKITELTGEECAVVTGDTPAAERAEVIDRLRGNYVQTDLLEEPKPPLKYCTNVAVMTTGLDIPNIDCVTMLRPTASPGLLLQCAGRGLRLAPNKTECVFLDFGGNILRHGPLDMIKDRVERKKRRNYSDSKGGEKDDDEDAEVVAKKCPNCNMLLAAATMTCPGCGYKFPEKKQPHLDVIASTLDVISKSSSSQEYDVKAVWYGVHEKRFSSPEDPKTMRVDYDLGNFIHKSEWVCPEHDGYARKKFEKWWKERAALGCPIPKDAREAVNLANSGALIKPLKIILKSTPGEKFDRIKSSVLPADKPVWDGLESYPKSLDEVTAIAPSPYSIDDQIPF